ncbi:FAD-dependent oxidoreductase [Haloferax mediterranei ATCC 33500]|uniref:FAD-dependent oxidoreductase n=1 Tax=Haloferax mediterranei (strain ATCC 33500 / DSM 1411 / JCM 8866 / NBRC 14739 / NCIMB 2177 / R-4) TaxID=523841 RepID=I3R5W1_HALMT|nr:FAD-dependent oxidoreductase [Haloferax mediterranei]AFK19621.1 FAD dependent oxidoreductase [Haloferax mediterranei ATCC 33500]AHZ23011.1 FAD-dependent oxidoreductase [Haloferax mediterranei ATCC 33500]ELZ99940.1 FAD dependent oxidoreductase [Haloferax mediterranei ATCC 33500]MDX5987638.1 FAD-dependent oxidoreductase [Haloferax mediterranei ATCC 33500]QCQ74125.1 FAD-dependent oxidoreductase [Haloferax mediterranei ATCC 33500]
MSADGAESGELKQPTLQSETPDYNDAYDAIVVGAGLAGTAAALTMAREGLDVLLLERGPAPGTKNVFGGVLYTPTIRELVDIDDAPMERYIAEKRFSMLTSDGDETAVSIRPGAWHDEPHNDSYTVLRRRFDEWFAKQAVEAGATLVTETTVTGVLRDGQTIVGVETDRPNGELRAPVVVLAEGANSLVSEAADLKERPDREDVAVSVKEVFKLDRETIDDRFRLDGDAGAAYHYFGEGAVGQAVGGGFVYTNKRTISVGIAYRIEDAAQGQTPEETLDAFESHPAVAPLIRGARRTEYAAHVIPEGGAKAMPDLVHDGAVVVGDAAGLVLNSGVHLEGTNMAVESGYHAGKAIAAALEDDRSDESALVAYPRDLEQSFVVENLRHYDWFQGTIADDRQFLFEDLPRALADAETEYFKMDRTSKDEHTDAARDRLLEAAGGWFGAAKRAWRFRRMLS